MNRDLLEQFERMAPFGSRNPEPVLCCRSVNVIAPSVVGNNHLKMRVSSNGVSRSSIWFSNGQYLKALSSAVLDIVFTPQFNHWNGNTDIQLKMKDIAIQANS